MTSSRGIIRFLTEEDEVPRWVILLLAFWVILFAALLLAGVDLGV